MGRGSSLKVFLWSGALALALGGSYLAWTFYGRKQADLQFEKRVEQKELEAGRRFRAAYGSDDVKISGSWQDRRSFAAGKKLSSVMGF
jgi:hypothetical protein